MFYKIMIMCYGFLIFNSGKILDDLISQLASTKSIVSFIFLVFIVVGYKLYHINNQEEKESESEKKESIDKNFKNYNTHQIKYLVAEGKSSIAIGVLKHKVSELLVEGKISNDVEKSVILLSNRMKINDYNKLNELVSLEEYNIESNKINSSIIEIINFLN